MRKIGKKERKKMIKRREERGLLKRRNVSNDSQDIAACVPARPMHRNKFAAAISKGESLAVDVSLTLSIALSIYLYLSLLTLVRYAGGRSLGKRIKRQSRKEGRENSQIQKFYRQQNLRYMKKFLFPFSYLFVFFFFNLKQDRKF